MLQTYQWSRIDKVLLRLLTDAKWASRERSGGSSGDLETSAFTCSH